ncbi:MAG: VWA domain-containing protein, partial [Chitinivibrionia bacterium]|nr:VWA domain-containing protein [Chitinivibrionia bacterium]
MRTFVGVGLKGIMILLFLLALLDPDLKGPGGWFGGTRVCTLFVLDRSESISSEAREDAERLVIGYMKGMSSRDRAGLVVFGKEPQVTWLGENDGVRWPGKAVLGETDGSETHGARALSLSASLFPEGFERHVVFFSDGRETGGPEELEAAAARLALDGIVLHGVPLGGRKTGLFLKNLRLPGTVQPGVPFSIRVAVEGKGTGELGVYRNGVLKARKSLRKDPPAVETTSFTLREEGTGYVQYEAVLQGAGATTPVQRKGGIIRIEGPLRVLYVDGKKSAGGGERPPLATLLHDEGLPVEWVSPEALSGRLSGMSPEWGAYGLVV